MVLVFLSSSALLLMLDLEFMALIYTMVYVGAISVFFIFVLMTINLRFEDSSEYLDEVQKEKNFSFFVLLLFSFLLQNSFFIQFKNLTDVKFLILYYQTLKQYNKKKKSFLSNNFFDLTSGGTGVDFSSYNSKVFNEKYKLSSKLADVSDSVKFNSSSNCTEFFFYTIDRKMQITNYLDYGFIGLDLFGEMQINFVVITFILLFSMIASINFAMRSK